MFEPDSELVAKEKKLRTLGWPNEQYFGEGSGLRPILFNKIKEYAQDDKLNKFGLEFSPNWGFASKLVEIQTLQMAGGKENLSWFNTNSFLGRLCASRGIIPSPNTPPEVITSLNKLSFQETIYSRFHESFKKIKTEDLKVNLGKLWKDFCAYSPQKDLTYTFDIADNFGGSNKEISNLLFATAKAYTEITGDANNNGQPIGYVEKKTLQKAKVKMEPGCTNFLIYQDKLGKVLTLRPNETQEDFAKTVSEALNDSKNWSELKKINQERMIAFNLSTDNEMFSDQATTDGFNGGEGRRPFLVYNLAKDKQGKLHLQGSANHLAIDGVLMKQLLRGGKTNNKKYLGIAGFYSLPLNTEKTIINQPCVESYNNVALGHLPKIEGGKTGADLYTYAVMWAWQIYQEEMQKRDPKLWNQVPASTSCNFTVTDSNNSLKPLASASCWTTSGDIYNGTELESISEVLSMFHTLCGFKWEKDKTNYEVDTFSNKIPEAMKLMALVVNSNLPESTKVSAMIANWSKLLTDCRLILFPATIITERGSDNDRRNL